MSKYISLENLERYDAKMQERIASFCASKEDGMWRQTEKAGAVSFWPVGNSPLEGTVEFLFKETGPASGDKSPTNPSTISGVSSIRVSRSGRNMISPSFYEVADTKTQNGITWTVEPDGTVVANGTATGAANSESGLFSFTRNYWDNYTSKSLCLSPGVYILSGLPIGSQWNKYLCRVLIGTSGAGSTQNFDQPVVTITITKTTIVTLRVTIWGGQTVSNLRFKPQLERASSASEYERGEVNQATINLNGTYYGGSIDLATGLMTVTWGAVVLDGTETWYKHNNSTEQVSVFRSWLNLPNYTMKEDMSASTRFCSHFSYSSDVVAGTFFSWGTSSRVYFKMDAANFPDVSDFTSWMASEYAAGHPVVFAYTRYAPLTVQLTTPQIRALIQPDKYVPRINTVYSDAENVQIVYQKNPVRDKFEKVQAIIAQGGNV